MDASKMSPRRAIGRVGARPVFVVLAPAALAVISAAVPAWSLVAPAPLSPSSTFATPATAPAVTSVAALEDAASEAVPVARAQFSQLGMNATVRLTRPHVLATEVADVIVRIRGGTICTGTPLTGTTFVVTAAHCVLDADGVVRTRTVLRAGVEYAAVSVLVNPGYHDSPVPRLDAAVLVMDRVIPGPSAQLGDLLPTHGQVTLAGFQPLDTDGSLLRGSSYDNRPLPQGATGGVVKIETAAAGCVHLVSELEITDTQVKVSCGLIPGASGGGLFVDNNGELILVGVISTVAADLTFNGLVPLTALRELLDNPDEYTHEMTVAASTQSNVVRS